MIEIKAPRIPLHLLPLQSRSIALLLIINQLSQPLIDDAGAFKTPVLTTTEDGNRENRCEDTMSAFSLTDLVRGGLSMSGSPPDQQALLSNEEHCEGDVLEEDRGSWSPPCLELRRKIAAQVESYLSDENLAEDAFLLKHVQRNKMGFVSLKLITSFKKVRELTRDWRTTLYATHCSEALEVNEEGTKVRRRRPVPNALLCTPTSKLLLAWNLLGESQAEEAGRGQHCLMETAMKLFGNHGAISSLRILRPGKELPPELKKYAKKHSELGRRVCAVVEFEYLEGARKAYEAFRAEQGLGFVKGVKVALLGSRGTRKSCYSQDPEESEDPEESVDRVASKKPTRKVKYLPYLSEDSSVYSSSESDFAPASPKPVRRVARPQALYGSPLAVQRPQPSYSSRPDPFGSPLSSPLLPRKLFAGGHVPSPLVAPDFGSSPVAVGSIGDGPRWSVDGSPDSGVLVSSPWVQRRKTAAQIFFPEKPGPPLPGLGRRSQVLVVVVRQPLGPDGTRGFHNCIGRGNFLLRH